jgi:histidinol phosphatase-like enzyme
MQRGKTRTLGCTNTMSIGAVVFDLDGVIVKTNFVKYAAMLSLFADHPEQQGAISEFILSNGGVPRRAKLAHLLQNNLCTEPTDALLSEYLRRYAIQLEHQLAVRQWLKASRSSSLATHRPATSARQRQKPRSTNKSLAGRSVATCAVYGSTTPSRCTARYRRIAFNSASRLLR